MIQKTLDIPIDIHFNVHVFFNNLINLICDLPLFWSYICFTFLNNVFSQYML